MRTSPPCFSLLRMLSGRVVSCLLVIVSTGASAQDLAPESIGNSIHRVFYNTSPNGPIGPFSFLYSKDGGIYNYGFGIGSVAIVRSTSYSWRKIGPNTGILQAPADTSLPNLVRFYTFTAPGTGTFRDDDNRWAGSFSLSRFELTSAAQMRNASSRIALAAGQPSMVGFVVTGDTPRRVLVRAVGPTLAQFGVAGVAPAPALTVLRGTAVVAANTRWGGETGLTAAFAAAGAFALPLTSADSALLLSLPPGAYTAQVIDTAGGEVLVEIYFVN
jgi:hypothetical protein